MPHSITVEKHAAYRRHPGSARRAGAGNPSFATILKVTHALGIKLHAKTA